MIYKGDCLDILPTLEDNSVDLLCTDPPYGISFMGKSWDKALPDKQIWKECLRVLKPGVFAFVMSIPRSDCLSRMIISLEDAGFRVDFTPIYWTYASGFPKAQNIGKAVDKRLGAEREVVGIKDKRYLSPATETSGAPMGNLDPRPNSVDNYTRAGNITVPATPQAKALDGSYGGFQPKPAVEVIIVAMKPLSEKTFVDQALKNRKGITWLDDCRVPYGSERDKVNIQSGRFPANLLVSDDVLNDGRVQKSGVAVGGKGNASSIYGTALVKHQAENQGYGDSGSFSRYFDLDKWWAKTFPFLIVPKASKSEKNKGLGDLPEKRMYGDENEWGKMGINSPNNRVARGRKAEHITASNNHPTVKPLKLMSYLITLGSREGDTVLDPFLGSGTTALACQLLKRECIGIEMKEQYCEIARHRLSQGVLA